jgi:hypothetical protein
MRTVQALEMAAMVNEYMLLVRGDAVINSNWADCTTGTLSVGAGCTAYLFTSLAELEAYAGAHGWELPVEEF